MAIESANREIIEQAQKDEKLKGMGTGKKIQYIWMYYKIHMLCVLLCHWRSLSGSEYLSSRTDEDGAFHCGGECREL